MGDGNAWAKRSSRDWRSKRLERGREGSFVFSLPHPPGPCSTLLPPAQNCGQRPRPPHNSALGPSPRCARYMFAEWKDGKKTEGRTVSRGGFLEAQQEE